ncbi:putative AC transposase [Fusarium oxysporum f. sp. raphani]|uniref:Putative AC transposase n=1 Tax=Fusarium oxysporum f. sp. raphani TaxID=96318 RepID=A0A8J5P4N7_FUSOX|nr:putative AC transposase [Fusarium oxysporum f. sp. raphani]
MPAPSFSSTPSSSRSADQFTELIIQPSIESSAKKSTTPSTGPLSSPSSVRAPRPLADGAFPIRWGALQYNNKRLSDAHYYMKHKRTTGKTKKSWIWDHGANIESENEQYWLCRRCHETGSDCSTIFKYNGNSAIAYHLKHKHGISEDGEVPQHIRVFNPWDRSKKANSFGPLRTPIAGEGYRQQYLDWVVAHDVSFRSATAGDTCDLLSYGRPELERLLPTSATTLSSWIMAAFETRRESLKAELKEYQRRQHFETLQAEALQDDELFSLQLIKDGGIRWNSTFSMLERALKLRNAIELFCAQWERDADYDLSQDFLKRSDWEEIQRFVALLKPFKDATLELEGHAIHGNYGALWQALEMMDILDGLLQEEKAAVAADSRSYSNYYVAGLDAGYTKLMKYFDLTAKTPYYRAAICLVPSFKLLYFKDKWRSHEIWVDTVEPDVRQLYNEYATKYSITEPASPPQQTEQPQQTPELGRFKLHRRLDRSVDVDSNSDRRKRRRMVDEFERYLYDEDVVEPFVEEPLTCPRPNDLDGILIEPDEFKLNGKQYVRYVVVAKSQKHTKKRTSVVWQYGEDIQLKQDLTKRFWYCYLCEQQQRQQGLPISGKGNCTALDHLESKHQIDRETGERRHAKRHPSQPSIVDFNNISTLVFKRRFDEFKELLIRWIVYCHIAFFQIENLYFRELLFYIFPGLTTLLPKARLVVRRWIIEAFKARKDSLRQEMQTAHCNISISFDIWTSPNYQAILGCVAHFINRSGKRRTVVLALRELVGEHSGENMADVLLHIFDDYGISGRIGYFMADNASSNDACIDLVLKALYPNMSRKHRVRRRLRCFGHIVNVCAQAFIMGKDASKTCKDLDSAYREGDYTRIRELWKKRGAIGRLHNIVRYIRASPQRRQFFRSIQISGDLAAFDGLELVQSQSTRWNSYFLSIGRALNVKERIQLFCDQYEPPQSDRDVLDQRLSPRQWDELGHLHDQLETFYEATVMNEGRRWTLADHFQSLDWLMDEIHLARRKFEQLAEDALRKRGPNRQDKHDEFDDYNWLAAAVEVAWQKCEKYYNKADESPAYYAAISLNPSLKNQWYYQVWNGSDDKRAWIQAAVRAVKELWVDEYKGKFAHGAPVPTHVFKSPEPKEKSFTSVRNHKRLKLRHFDPHSSPELPLTDHYNEFITTDVIGLNDDEEFDPIQYWNERYHSQTNLARMALDVLALPPMSDECERLFSSAKLLLTDHRSRLWMDVIEASECLRAWYGRPEQKAFEDSAIGLMEGEAGSTVGADGPGEGE